MSGERVRVAHVSTFPPMQCGIAFYADDLIRALPAYSHGRYVLHYGDGCLQGADDQANLNEAANVRALARAISSSGCSVVSLQHEFGIWGGSNGEHLHDFLVTCEKPIVSTLHTTFKRHRRPEVQYALLEELVRRSETVIVLTSESRRTLCGALAIPTEALTVVPHGVPDIAFVPPPHVKTDKHGREVWKLCSIGFMRPDKGIEQTLHGLRALADQGRRFEYRIAGGVQLQFPQQSAYLDQLRKLISVLKLDDVVTLDARILSREEQIAAIQHSHAGVFAYQDPDHASSGTIPLVMAAGRPVICTPFEFGFAKEAEVGGVTIAKGFDAGAISEAIVRSFAQGRSLVSETKSLYRRTRPWTWGSIGPLYANAYEQAVHRG